MRGLWRQRASPRAVAVDVAVAGPRTNTPGGDTAEARARLVGLARDLQTALAHHRAGEIAEAEAGYRSLLEKVPNHPQALHMLGVLETERGRPRVAIELIGQALRAVPNFADAHVNMGNALGLAGEREPAIESYRQALASRPDFVIAHSHIARVQIELRRFEAAITHCQAAIAIDSTFLPARINLARALKAAGRMQDAGQAWRDVIALEPGRAESYYELGVELSDLGQYEAALHALSRAVAFEPGSAAFHCARGGILMRTYAGEEAAASFRRALILAPDSKDAVAGLGWALRLLGRFDEADVCFRRLQESDPADARSYRHLSADGQHPRTGEEDRLLGLLDQSNGNVEQRITAGFALGRLLDNAGRYDEAFPRYAAANALVRQTWPEGGENFHSEAFTGQVNGLIGTYTPRLLAEMAGNGSMSELPVFIVGMPRSGTTLVEQICASHSRVHGAGELVDITRMAAMLGRERENGSGQHAADTAQRLANAHVVRLHELGGGAIRVVDKMPDNILQVGLIATLFPRARIIYCSRDSRDISLSCFFQLFSTGAQFFSYDLADCGRRCREVQRLAAHWLELLPEQMLEINYEKLVSDLEGESQRLIAFLGLDWEPACIEFHRTERTVATVSHWQVRQPLYNSSVGRWKHYEKHLAPLFAAVNGF
jgi:tetratricopeptide (TPR) repeat protein